MNIVPLAGVTRRPRDRMARIWERPRRHRLGPSETDQAGRLIGSELTNNRAWLQALAVEVLAKMKKKNAAEIMNLLPADKARVLSEKYTGYRRNHPADPGLWRAHRPAGGRLLGRGGRLASSAATGRG